MDMVDNEPAPRTGRIILLGSTGSIGLNTIEVVKHLAAEGGPDYEIIGLAAGSRADLLRDQARDLGVSDLAIADASKRGALDGTGTVHAGPDAALELIDSIARPGDLVVGAIVGAAGIAPTLAAIERGCDIALANKETLVAAGKLVIDAASANSARIIPVDSEHSAIYQCLRGGRSPEEIERLVLTASGGPFRTWEQDRMEHASVAEALAHPTWSMGPKVTIDSASMMNKALELIEAHWLFGLPSSQLDAVIHPQSIVHSFVEFIDGSVFGQLSPRTCACPSSMPSPGRNEREVAHPESTGRTSETSGSSPWTMTGSPRSEPHWR